MKIKPKYFDDFHIGETFETEPNFISKDEIIDFASKYDPQSFHLDEDAAKNGPFGRLTSSGFMTLGKSFTQIFNTNVFNGSSMGAWGLDELRWTKPVYPGDTLKTQVEVLEKKLSSKNPIKGTVRLKQTVYNQNEDVVMTWISNSMIKVKI
tara:strand:- start:126 stop:578 length:453 start_codon:yes stop_codon:yes gene_type:complete